LVTGAVPAEDANVSRTTYGLTQDGTVTSVTAANGHTAYITNDELGRAVQTTTPQVSEVRGEGEPVTSVANTLVGYNTFGEATEQQDEYGNVSINRYDALGRMVEQQSPVYTATLPARRRTPTTTRAARGRWRTRPPG
jgi:hypothetical protein